jgi:hypothetical protein
MKFMDLPSVSALNADLNQVPLPPGGHTVLTCVLETYSCKATNSDKKVAHSLENRLSEQAQVECVSPQGVGARAQRTNPHQRKVLIYLILALNTSFPEYDFSGVASRALECFKPCPPTAVQHDIDLALQEAYRYIDEQHESLRRGLPRNTTSLSAKDHWPSGIGRIPRRRQHASGRCGPQIQSGTSARTLAIASAPYRRKRVLDHERVVASAPCSQRGLAGKSLASSALGQSSCESLTSLLGTRERLWTTVQQVIAFPNCEIYTYVEADDTDGPFHEPGIIWSFNYFFYNHALRRVLFMKATAVQMLHPERVPTLEWLESESFIQSDSATEDERIAEGTVSPMGETRECEAASGAVGILRKHRSDAQLIFDLNP